MASILEPRRSVLFLLPRLCPSPRTDSPHNFFSTHDLGLGRPGLLAREGQEAGGGEQRGRRPGGRRWGAARSACLLAGEPSRLLLSLPPPPPFPALHHASGVRWRRRWQRAWERQQCLDAMSYPRWSMVRNDCAQHRPPTRSSQTSHGFRRNQIGHGKEGRDLGRSNDEGKKKNLAREFKKIKVYLFPLLLRHEFL